MKGIVEISEDDFIDMLWERVGKARNVYNDYFDDEVWEECFNYLSEIGWLDPQHNTPSYIVDNLAINSEIVAKEDLPSEYGKSFEEMSEEDYMFDTTNFVVFNLGL